MAPGSGSSFVTPRGPVRGLANDVRSPKARLCAAGFGTRARSSSCRCRRSYRSLCMQEVSTAASGGQIVFAHKSAMQQHSREAHRGDLKPHQCTQCLKSFSSTHQLAQHVRIHTGEKPYKCSYCERRFKQLSHVQQHTRLHTGERPYKCHVAECGRAFIQLSNLQQHLRNHDSQMERAKSRPFHCNICGKGFASDSSLRTHRSKAELAAVQDMISG
ncbi:hypothetical protein HPB50_000882 [Hyalomma asiaticum]|uniref:Uncharacterized protein n=1 Tax=Hyalomma asiaticum TaxID=266040 RepID=A0ACB7S9G9_HYAAI|nr:hypothetical protein HPB50_000882 [Hyalomma asiaticum]